MNAYVDKSGCIGCGLCAEICPDVFRMGDDGLAEAFAPVRLQVASLALEAKEACPVSVITLED